LTNLQEVFKDFDPLVLEVSQTGLELNILNPCACQDSKITWTQLRPSFLDISETYSKFSNEKWKLTELLSILGCHINPPLSPWYNDIKKPLFPDQSNFTLMEQICKSGSYRDEINQHYSTCG